MGSERLNDDGYPIVHLSKCGDSAWVTVHRLVAQAFVPNPKCLPEVNHIDMCRTNNNATNLEWVTHIDNVRHSSEHGKYKHYGSDNPNYGGTKLKEYFAAHPDECLKLARHRSQNGRATPIRMCGADYDDCKQFGCLVDCAEYLIEHGFTTSENLKHVACMIGKAAKCGESKYGFVFKYA